MYQMLLTIKCRLMLIVAGYLDLSTLEEALEGDPAEALSILLVLLPQLRTLHMTESFIIGQSLLDLLDHVNANDGQTAILQHLSTVGLFFDDDDLETSQDVGDLSCWASLPAMQCLKAARLRDEDEVYEWQYFNRPCNIERIDFEKSYLRPDTIEAMLAPMKALQDFSYEASWLSLSVEDRWDIISVVDSLRKHLASTLRRLRITCEDDETNGIGWQQITGPITDLTSFTALQFLDINAYGFIERVPKDTSPPATDSSTTENDPAPAPVPRASYFGTPVASAQNTAPKDEDEFGLPSTSTHTITKIPRLIDILPPSIQELRLTFLGNPSTQCAKLFENIVIVSREPTRDRDRDRDREQEQENGHVNLDPNPNPNPNPNPSPQSPIPSPQ